MKWNLNTTLLLLAFLIISYLAWENWIIKKTNQTLQTQNLKKQVDTQEVEVEKKVTEWKTKKVIAEKIVDKWRTDTITYTNIDTLYLEAKKDIFSLDTALYSCELALGSCLSLKNTQSELIKNLENRKSPLIVPVVGVGLSMNKDYVVQPSINATIGINLNKIFGKK